MLYITLWKLFSLIILTSISSSGLEDRWGPPLTGCPSFCSGSRTPLHCSGLSPDRGLEGVCLMSGVSLLFNWGQGCQNFRRTAAPWDPWGRGPIFHLVLQWGGKREITLRGQTSSVLYREASSELTAQCVLPLLGFGMVVGSQSSHYIPCLPPPQMAGVTPHCTDDRILHPNYRHLASAEWLVWAKYFSILSLSSSQPSDLADKETAT